MKIKINLTLLMLCCVSFFYAQQQTKTSCGFDQATTELLKDPQARKAHEAYNKYAKNFEKQLKSGALSAKMNTTYTIPVVVHVYGRTQHGKTITYQKVKNAIDIVNEDFNGQNSDFNSVDNFFRNRRGTLSIRFELAKLDPNGASTDGVLFHDTVEKGFGLRSFDNNVKDYAWDNYKYMNVYIMGDAQNDGGSTQSGIAWLPDTGMSNDNLARVVYNGQYLHDNATNKEFAQLTHEFGHYLNLYHTFNGGCNDANGDFVNDTPKEDSTGGDKGCVVGASECGNLINYENYMGYDAATGCSKMFTLGQVTRMVTGLNHPTRQTLWTTANLAATGVTLDKAYFEADNTIYEANSNNGSIEKSSYDITIKEGTFALSSGNLTQGTHYSSSLPSGLSASISVVNNTTIRLNLSGNAASHAVSNNGSGSITFNNAAITGGTSSLVSNKLAFNFKFHDPYKVVYNNIADLTARTGAVWHPFTIKESGMNNKYGIFFNGGDLEIEPNKQALVMQAGTRNVTLIQANQLISSASNWVNGGVFPNLPDVKTSSYTTWHGRTGYVGFQLKGLNAQTLHGWMQIRVNNNGSQITLLDYAYSTRPNGPIKAGSQTIEPEEPTCNDGIQNGDETGQDCGGSCTPCSSTVNAGTVSTSTNQTAVTTTTGDDIADVISFRKTGNTNDTYIYLITDDTGKILTTEASSHDFEGSTAGICRVYGFAYKGTLSVTNKNVADAGLASGDFDVSNNWITVTRVSPTTDPTCNDGIQNGDETGQDCGGSCAPCQTDVTYCDASTTSSTLHITNVSFGSIDNTTTHTAYSNHTSISTSLAAGQATALTVKANNDHWTFNAVGVWIDWNNNGDFTDAGELVYSKFGAGPYSSNVTPPSGAVGNTSLRMRVRIGYGSESKITPCGTDTYIGEVEDYTVTVGGVTNPDPTCTDGIQNGDETGKDCGGSCAPCEVEPTCNDGIQNGDETGQDCGGSCAPCQTNVTYCDASTTSSTLHITNVSFGSINNTTAHTSYSNHTNISTVLSAGQSTALTVKANNDHWTFNAVGVWIDWNNNGDFTDSGELVYSRYGAGPYSGNITSPSGAVSGTALRMRVRIGYGSRNKITPCGTDTYIGEVEDYTVSIGASKSASLDVSDLFSVSVNPSKDGQLKLSLGNSQVGNLELKLYDATGKQVARISKKKGSENSLSIPIELNSGFYIVKGSINGVSEAKSFIVE